MKILFVAAVDFELNLARGVRPGAGDSFLCTGMGPEATRRALEPLLAAGGFDLVVDLGVAGSYDTDRFPVGSVAQVTAEQFGDRPGALLRNPAPPACLAGLPQAVGNTVSALEPQYRCGSADVESMEGAAFFEACLAAGVPFAEIRAVSNAVGEEDRSRWNIPLALANLQSFLNSLTLE